MDSSLCRIIWRIEQRISGENPYFIILCVKEDRSSPKRAGRVALSSAACPENIKYSCKSNIAFNSRDCFCRRCLLLILYFEAYATRQVPELVQPAPW